MEVYRKPWGVSCVIICIYLAGNVNVVDSVTEGADTSTGAVTTTTVASTTVTQSAVNTTENEMGNDTTTIEPTTTTLSLSTAVTLMENETISNSSSENTTVTRTPGTTLDTTTTYNASIETTTELLDASNNTETVSNETSTVEPNIDLSNGTQSNETIADNTSTTEVATTGDTTVTTTDTTTDMPPRVPYLSSAYPLFGPVAGGTLVTIRGQNLDLVNASKVILGNKEIEIYNQTRDFIMFTTLETEQYKTWPITLKGPIQVPTNFQFTFKPNPKIASLFPGAVIMSGGVSIFAEGEFMDSVSRPVLNFYVRFDTEGDIEEETFSQVCVPLNITLLECKTPNFTLVSGIVNNRNRRDITNTVLKRRQKREFFVQKRVTITIELGFQLDGFTRYQNVTQSLPEYGTITVVPDPIIHSFGEIREYASQDVYLNISGEGLNQGCTIHDYDVKIAGVACKTLQLEANWLTCIIPNLTNYIDNTTGIVNGVVIVRVGPYISQEVGRLRYIAPVTTVTQSSTGGGSDLALIVGIIAGCVVLAVVIIVIGMIKFKPWKKKQSLDYIRQPLRPLQFTDPSAHKSTNNRSGDSQQGRGRDHRRIPVFNIFKEQGDYLQSMGRPPELDSLKSEADENNFTATHSLRTGRYMVHSENLGDGDFPVY